MKRKILACLLAVAMFAGLLTFSLPVAAYTEDDQTDARTLVSIAVGELGAAAEDAVGETGRYEQIMPLFRMFSEAIAKNPEAAIGFSTAGQGAIGAAKRLAMNNADDYHWQTLQTVSLHVIEVIQEMPEPESSYGIGKLGAALADAVGECVDEQNPQKAKRLIDGFDKLIDGLRALPSGGGAYAVLGKIDDRTGLISTLKLLEFSEGAPLTTEAVQQIYEWLMDATDRVIAAIDRTPEAADAFCAVGAQMLSAIREAAVFVIGDTAKMQEQQVRFFAAFDKIEKAIREANRLPQSDTEKEQILQWYDDILRRAAEEEGVGAELLEKLPEFLLREYKENMGDFAGQVSEETAKLYVEQNWYDLEGISRDAQINVSALRKQRGTVLGHQVAGTSLFKALIRAEISGSGEAMFDGLMEAYDTVTEAITFKPSMGLSIGQLGGTMIGAAIQAAGYAGASDRFLSAFGKVTAAMTPYNSFGHRAAGEGLLAMMSRLNPATFESAFETLTGLYDRMILQMPTSLEAALNTGNVFAAALDAIGGTLGIEGAAERIESLMLTVAQATQMQPDCANGFSAFGQGLIGAQKRSEMNGRGEAGFEVMKQVTEQVIAAIRKAPEAHRSIGKVGTAAADAIGETAAMEGAFDRLFDLLKMMLDDMTRRPDFSSGMAIAGQGVIGAQKRCELNDKGPAGVEVLPPTWSIIVKAMYDAPDTEVGLGKLGAAAADAVAETGRTELLGYLEHMVADTPFMEDYSFIGFGTMTQGVIGALKRMYLQNKDGQNNVMRVYDAVIRGIRDTQEGSVGLGKIGAAMADCIGEVTTGDMTDESNLEKIRVCMEITEMLVADVRENPAAWVGHATAGQGLVGAVKKCFVNNKPAGVYQLYDSLIAAAMLKCPQEAEAIGKIGSAWSDALGETGKDAGVVAPILTAIEDNPEAWVGYGIAGQGMIGAVKRCNVNNKPTADCYAVWEEIIAAMNKATGAVGTCVTYTSTELQPGTLNVTIGGKRTDELTFEPVFGGWKIKTHSGDYLTTANGELRYTDYWSAPAWTYRNGSLSTTQSVIEERSGFWFLFWYIPETTMRRNITYYLSTTTPGAKLSEQRVTVEFSKETDWKYHRFGEATSLGNGTHQRTCMICGATQTSACTYGGFTHCCTLCGKHDATGNEYTASVSTGSREYIGWFWTRGTVYTATVSVSNPWIARKIEYSSDNLFWRTGSVLTANTEIAHFWFRITDIDGQVRYFEYQNGTVYGNEPDGANRFDAFYLRTVGDGHVAWYDGVKSSSAFLMQSGAKYYYDGNAKTFLIFTPETTDAQIKAYLAGDPESGADLSLLTAAPLSEGYGVGFVMLNGRFVRNGERGTFRDGGVIAATSVYVGTGN